MDALRRYATYAAALALLALAGGLAARPAAPRAAAAGPCATGTDALLDADELAFLTLINNYRGQNGLPALRVSYMLSKSSAWKSKHMGQNAYFNHDDTPIGRSWYQRSVDCGYNHNTYVGENIAAGYGNAQDVFNGWKNSQGHNENMLGANYTVIGIGKAVVPGSPYGTYWTTVFGGFDDGWAKTGPETIVAIGTITSVGGDADARALVAPQAALPAALAAPGRSSAGQRVSTRALCAVLRDTDRHAWRRLCAR